MFLDDILAINFSAMNVCIVGLAASGKSHVAAKLYGRNPTHTLISTDSYLPFNYEQGLYELISDLGNPEKHDFNPIIVEGILNFRLLRKGLDTDCWKPDAIIFVENSRKQRHEIYLRERDASKLKYMQSFDLGLLKIWNEYLQSPVKKPPIFTLNNEH